MGSVVKLSLADTARPPLRSHTHMFQHSGTPPGITAAFDCAARNATWHFGRSLLPERASFATLFDALQQHRVISLGDLFGKKLFSLHFFLYALVF